MKTGIGLDKPKPVFTYKTVDFLDVDFGGLGNFLGGGAGAGSEVVENLQVMIVFLFDAGRTDISAPGHGGINSAAPGAIGKAHRLRKSSLVGLGNLFQSFVNHVADAHPPGGGQLAGQLFIVHALEKLHPLGIPE